DEESLAQARPEEQGHPRRAAEQSLPGPLPHQVRYEEGGGDLAGDGQGEDEPAEEVPPSLQRVQEADDEEEDEQVDVAVHQVARGGAQAQEHGQDLGPER